MSSNETEVRGVIFDVDGTLVNSNDAHARAWHAALAEHGFDVPLSAIEAAIGMGGDKLLPAVAGLNADSALGRDVGARRAELFRTRFLPQLKAFPQTRQLLIALRGKGMKLAVATSAKQDELDALLQVAQVPDLLEGAASANDASSSKPDPDIVQAALERLEIAPAHVVMVGDTRFDIEAAARAGLRAIALRCGGRSDQELAGALAIYDDPADLLAHLRSAPFH